MCRPPVQASILQQLQILETVSLNNLLGLRSEINN